MPANLTPQYLKAEQAYRRATTPEEELDCLQVMLRELPKHKGTDKLHAELKQKVSKAKKELQHSKATGGKRLLRMSPLHHHFELGGWSGPRIATRFQLVTALCVALAFAIRQAS